MEQEEIVKRIRELVDEKRMTDSAFANTAGIGPSNFRKKLIGQQTITGRDITLICQAFRVSPDWLQHGSGEKYIAYSTDETYLNIKSEILDLARRLTRNKETIIRLQRENDDIVNQLSALYAQLDKIQ